MHTVSLRSSANAWETQPVPIVNCFSALESGWTDTPVLWWIACSGPNLGDIVSVVLLASDSPCPCCPLGLNTLVERFVCRISSHWEHSTFDGSTPFACHQPSRALIGFDLGIDSSPLWGRAVGSFCFRLHYFDPTYMMAPIQTLMILILLVTISSKLVCWRYKSRSNSLVTMLVGIFCCWMIWL